MSRRITRRGFAGLSCGGLMGAAREYFPPPDGGGGWRAAKSAALDDVFTFIQGSTKHGGLLVVREGWLVYERYFGRGSREATPNTASCGKMFTSVAMGILLGERPDLFPRGLDQKVYTPRYLPPEAFPPDDAAKAEIRLGQLLAMTAGLRGNNPAYIRGRPVRIDPTGPDGWQAMVDETALRTGLWCRPGAGYCYATVSPHLVSMILRRAAGMEMGEYLARRLAGPLGWGRWGWGYRRPEIVHTPGGGGIALRATDMLRFGYLLLRGGRWGGRRIVPADYVRQCGTRSRYNPHYPYSLQFDVNADGHVAGAPRDAFWKQGSGGFCLYVAPSLDLVIWKMGGRDEQYDPRQTGLPEGSRYDGSREGWKRAVEEGEAARRTLEMVVAAGR